MTSANPFNNVFKRYGYVLRKKASSQESDSSDWQASMDFLSILKLASLNNNLSFEKNRQEMKDILFSDVVNKGDLKIFHLPKWKEAFQFDSIDLGFPDEYLLCLNFFSFLKIGQTEEEVSAHLLIPYSTNLRTLSELAGRTQLDIAYDLFPSYRIPLTFAPEETLLSLHGEYEKIACHLYDLFRTTEQLSVTEQLKEDILTVAMSALPQHIDSV